jgi:outer membrane protein assembly factor BamB
VLSGLVNAACLQFRPPPAPVPEALEGPYHVAWSTSAGRGTSGAIAVADGVAYLGGTDRTVYAVDLATGVVKWRRRLAGAILGGVVLSDGTVFVGTDRPQGAVAALDAATGAQRWRTLRWRTGLPLAVGAGVVAMHEREGHIVALEPGTGRVRWRRRVGASLTPPVALADAILVTTLDSVFRLAPADGAVLARAAGPGDVPGGWRIAGTQLIGGTARGDVVALNPGALTVAWRVALGSPVLAPLGANGDTLLAGTAAGDVWAVPPGSGRRILRTGRPIAGPPAADGGLLLVPGADGTLRAYGLDGAERWRFNHWRPLGVPAVRLPGGDLLVVGSNGDLARYTR